MLFLTHATIAAATCAGITGTLEPNVLAIAVVGSIIPDMDTTKSIPGKIFWPIAKWIEERYPHRSITHCLWVSLALAILGAPLIYFFNWHYAIALPIGHLSAVFADAFTKDGCRAFYPARPICVAGLNPRYRIQSGSAAEFPVLVGAIALLCGLLYFNSGGGVMSAFSRALFPNSGTAAELFIEQGQKQQVIVEVEGIHNRTAAAIKDTFLVLDATTSSLVAMDARGLLYRIGNSGADQIRPTSIKSKLGGQQQIRTRTQDVVEADADQWLNSLLNNVFLSGQLIIEEGSEISVPNPEYQVMQTMAVSGTSVTLDFAQKYQLAPLLRGQWITSGRVIIKEFVNGTQ